MTDRMIAGLLAAVLLVGVAEAATNNYSRFVHPSPGNEGLYVFVVGPAALLDTTVPADARNAVAEWDIQYDAEGVETNRVPVAYKTVRESLQLAPALSVDGSTCAILLNEYLSPRQTGVTVADVAFWDLHLAAFGLGSDSGAWLTIEEYQALLSTPAWSTEN